MNCEYYRELISVRQDDELLDDDERQLIGHLAECEACRKFARELEELSQVMSSWPAEKMPSEAEEYILDQTARKKRRKSPLGFLKGYYRIPRGAAWAAVVLLVFLLIENAGLFSERGGEAGLPSDKPEAEITVQKIILTKHDVVSQYTIYGKVNN